MWHFDTFWLLLLTVKDLLCFIQNISYKCSLESAALERAPPLNKRGIETVEKFSYHRGALLTNNSNW